MRIRFALLVAVVVVVVGAVASGAGAAIVRPPAGPDTSNIKPEVAGIFLCYSKSQVIPGVWPTDVAKTLIAAGYWEAYAVPGNVVGGTNIGSFNLVCNPSAAQATTNGGYVEARGNAWEVVPNVPPEILGTYAVVGAPST